MDVTLPPVSLLKRSVAPCSSDVTLSPVMVDPGLKLTDALTTMLPSLFG